MKSLHLSTHWLPGKVPSRISLMIAKKTEFKNGSDGFSYRRDPLADHSLPLSLSPTFRIELVTGLVKGRLSHGPVRMFI